MVLPVQPDNPEQVFEITAQNRRIILHTKDATLQNDPEILKGVAATILEKETSGPDQSKTLLAIRVKEYVRNQISYTLLENGITKTSDLLNPLSNTVERVQKLALPILEDRPPPANPVLSILKAILELVTHPIRFFTKQDHVLSRRDGMASRHTFNATVEFTINLLESQNTRESLSLAKKLKKGLSIAETLQKRAQKNDHKITIELDVSDSNELIIPIGVGEGKDYIPHFVWFKRNCQDQTAVIEVFHLSSPSAECKTFVKRTYTLADNNRGDIHTLLNQLCAFIPLDIPPKKEVKPFFRSPLLKWVPGIDYLKSLYEKKTTKPSSEHANSPIETINGVIVAAGGVLSEHQAESEIVSTSADPLKLMFELCKNEVPSDNGDRVTSGKADFYRKWMEASIQSLNNSRSTMSASERTKALEMLLKDLKSFSKAVASEIGKAASKAVATDLKKKIELELDLEGRLKAKESERIRRLNIEPVQFKIEIRDSYQSDGIVSRNLSHDHVGGLSDRIGVDYATILNSPKPSLEQCRQVIEQLETYLNEIDRIHNEGSFKITKIRLLALLKAFPVPTGRHTNENGIFWTQLDIEGLDRAMRALSRLSNLSWERIMKTWDYPVDPSYLLEMNMVLSANMRYVYHLRVQKNADAILEKISQLPQEKYKEINEGLFKKKSQLTFERYFSKIEDKLTGILEGIDLEERNYLRSKFKFYLASKQRPFIDSLEGLDLMGLYQNYHNRPGHIFNVCEEFVDGDLLRKYLTGDNDKLIKVCKVIHYLHEEQVVNQIVNDEGLLAAIKAFPTPDIMVSSLNLAPIRGYLAKELELSNEEAAYFVMFRGYEKNVNSGVKVSLEFSQCTSFDLNFYQNDLSLLFASDQDHERLISLEKLKKEIFCPNSNDPCHYQFYSGYHRKNLSKSEQEDFEHVENFTVLSNREAVKYFVDPYMILLKEHNIRMDLLNRPLNTKFHYRPIGALVRGVFQTIDADWLKKRIRDCNRLILQVAENGILNFKSVKYVVTDGQGEYSDILVNNENPLTSSLNSNAFFWDSDLESIRNPVIYDRYVNNRTPLLGLGQRMSKQSHDQNTVIELFDDLTSAPNINLNFYETWKLHALQLKGNDKIQGSLYQKSELSHITIKVSLEFLCQYPRLLNQDLVQHRIYNLFTQPMLLKSALLSDPKFFVDIGKKLKEVLDKIPKGDHLAILFVQDICGKIHEEVEWLEDFVDSDAPSSEKEWIPDVYLKGFKSFSQEIKNSIPENDQLLVHKLFRHQRESNLQRGYAIFLLDQARRSEPKNVTEWVNVLQAYSILCHSSATVGHPYLFNSIMQYMKSDFIPKIAEMLRNDEELRNNIINELSKSHGNWNATEFLYQFKDENNHTIDISTGLGFKLIIRDLSDCTLPDSVLASNQFNLAFGKDFQPRARSTSKEDGIVEFSFEVDDVPFKINYNSSNGQFTLYQIFEGTAYKFETMECHESSLKVAQLINEKGTWINPQTNEIYLARFKNLLKSEKILLHFKTSFFKRYLVSASIGVGKDRVWICQDKYEIFIRTLRCCSGRNVLMTTKNDRKRLERIDLPTGLTLIRKEGNTWVQEDRPNFQWWIEDTQPLESEFGSEYSEFMLPLVDKDENRHSLWIYPYGILTSGKSNAKLNFLKPEEDKPLPSVLKLEKTQKGYKGSHAAFLYIAYYFHVRGEYNKATEYLDLMWKFGTTDENTIKSLLNIQSFLISFPSTTHSQKAFLLKALLNLNMVLRDASGSHGILQENNDKAGFLIPGFAEVYNQSIIDPALKQKLSEQGLMLTKHEIDELRKFKELNPSLPAVVNVPKLFKIPKLHAVYPTVDEMKNFTIVLKDFTVSEKIKNIHDLHKTEGSYPKIDTVLTHFWDYVTWISTQKLKHPDVHFLYNSTPSLRSFEDPRSSAAVETARRFLIMLYEMKSSIHGIQGLFENEDGRIGDIRECNELRLLRENVQSKRSAFPSSRINPNGEISVAGIIQGSFHLTKDHPPYNSAVDAYFRLFFDYLINNSEKKEIDDYIGNVKLFGGHNRTKIRRPDAKEEKESLEIPYNYSFDQKVLDSSELKEITYPVAAQSRPSPYRFNAEIYNQWDLYFNRVESLENVDQKVATIQSYLSRIKGRTDDLGAMVRGEVERIEKSVQLAKNELDKTPSRILKEGELDTLTTQVKQSLRDQKAKVQNCKNSLLQLARENASGLAIIEEDESFIIESLLKMYSSEFWNGFQDQAIVNLLDHSVTDFLLASTELQQLKKAGKCLEKLKGVNPSSKTWEYLSTELHYHLSEGCNQARLQKYGQELYKIFLIHEYQNQVICRDKAVQGVKDLLNEKPVFAKIKMGIGKSTFIFPKLAEIYLKAGIKPVVVFTDKLLRQSTEYMDPKAYVFNFDRSFGIKKGGNDQIEIEHLHEIYLTLQKLQSQGRYVITTPERRAALREKKAELEDQLNELCKEKKFDQIEKICLKLRLICDISNYFFDKDTRYLIDEDANLNINLEFNYSRGDDTEVNKARSSMAYQLMSWLLFKPIPPEKFPLLSDLRAKILEKKVQSLPYSQVEAALVELAEYAMLDEKYWTQIIGFTPEQFAKLKHENSFVKFVMQIKENNEFIVPKNIRSLENDAKNDRTLRLALNKLEIFQKQISEAFKSVYKTHPDLRRGIQKASKCVIIPVEEGIEKPNFIFGKEDEVILHHYLFYAVNPPDNDFFDNEFRSLSAKDTGGWAEWNESICNGDSPYANISKPEFAFHRMMFCKHILEETKRVRIYNYQYVCNSQDATLGQPKSVASGTGYPHVINMVEPSSKEDYVDSITGDTLLRMKFEQKVKVSQSILHDLVELPKDKHCLGILNQAYALCGNDSAKLAKTLQVASNSGRSFPFVDSETREKRVIIPGKEPVSMQNDILNENDFLVLGPRDTRGIDFKLARGESYYLTALFGSTTLLDDLEQTLGRMREHGQGQEANLLIDEVMASRITSWSGVPAENITEGLVALDIILRTIEEKASSNTKSAIFRVEGLFKSRLERAFNDFEPTLEGALIHSAIFDGFQQVFIIDRTNRPSERFADIKMLNPKEFMKDTYEKALFKLRTFLDLAIKNVIRIQNPGFSDFEFKNEKEKIYKALFEGDSKFPQELLKVFRAVKVAEENLSNELDKIDEWEAYYNKHMPKGNASNTTMDNQVELQILIQIQLHIEQMVHQIRTGVPKERKYPIVTLESVETVLTANKTYESHKPLTYYTNEAEYNLPQKIRDEFFNFRISRSASDLLWKMNTSEQPVFYTLASFHNAKWHFCIVTQGDWSARLSYEFLSKRYHPDPSLSNMTAETSLYPLFWENTDTMIAVDGKRIEKHTDEFILEFNKLRFVLGYVKFNKAEKRLLSAWLQTLSLEKIKDFTLLFNECERPEANKLLAELDPRALA